jgi:hypothetical protein
MLVQMNSQGCFKQVGDQKLTPKFEAPPTHISSTTANQANIEMPTMNKNYTPKPAFTISFSDDAKKLLNIADQPTEKKVSEQVKNAIVEKTTQRKIVINRACKLTIDEKKQLIRAKRLTLTPHDMLAIVKFLDLPDTYFKLLLDWGSKEWYNYGMLREWELYANRHLEDVPEDKRSPTDDPNYYGEAKEILTPELFKKFNKRPEFSYEFYSTMSAIDERT